MSSHKSMLAEYTIPTVTSKMLPFLVTEVLIEIRDIDTIDNIAINMSAELAMVTTASAKTSASAISSAKVSSSSILSALVLSSAMDQ